MKDPKSEIRNPKSKMGEVSIRIPASSSNLGPGFDCLGLALGLYNRVVVQETDSGRIEIAVAGEGAGEVPTSRDNLVWSSMEYLFRKVGYETGGVRLDLENGIPIARGLGSSAAARIGGLMAGKVLSGADLDEQDILNMAFELEGHPDNAAPALMGGLVISSARGTHVDCVRIEPPEGIMAVLAVPSFELATERARSVLPEKVSLTDAVYNMSCVALLTAAFATGEVRAIRSAMEDRVHQPYRASLIPGMHRVFDAALEAGALGVAISGAGPTILALADANSERIGRSMCSAWKERGIDSRALVLDIERRGVVVER